MTIGRCVGPSGRSVCHDSWFEEPPLTLLAPDAIATSIRNEFVAVRYVTATEEPIDGPNALLTRATTGRPRARGRRRQARRRV
ncbi:hypothetical protein [Streptomyces sp. NPDC049813]|uniref:hypothetical protein n=1 Tax=Streptomyces sp. NPDC049813 TaxID=3365597 RepID=UPI003791780D